MPLFEFRCGSCGERFESLRSRSDEAAPRCPRCGAADAERLPSAFAVTHASPGARAGGPCGSPDCACMRPMPDA